MKKVLLALLVGLAMGYWWGYGEAHDGLDNVAVRTLNKFGAANIKNAQAAREEREKEALQP